MAFTTIGIYDILHIPGTMDPAPEGTVRIRAYGPSGDALLFYSAEDGSLIGTAVVQVGPDSLTGRWDATVVPVDRVEDADGNGGAVWQIEASVPGGRVETFWVNPDSGDLPGPVWVGDHLTPRPSPPGGAGGGSGTVVDAPYLIAQPGAHAELPNAVPVGSPPYFMRKVQSGQPICYVDTIDGDDLDDGLSPGSAKLSLDLALTGLDGGTLGHFGDYGVAGGARGGQGHVYFRGLALVTRDNTKWGTRSPSGPDAGGIYVSPLWVGLGGNLHGVGPFVGYSEIRWVDPVDGASELNPYYALQTGYPQPPTPAAPTSGTDTVWLGLIEDLLLSCPHSDTDNLQFVGGLFDRNPTNMAMIRNVNIGTGGGGATNGDGKFPLHGFRMGGDNYGTRLGADTPPLWAATHAYAVGDVITPPVGGQAYYFRWFVCIQAGTSGAVVPTFTDWPTVNVDGTVRWLAIFNGSGPNFALAREIFVHGGKIPYLIEGGSTDIEFYDCGVDPDVVYSEDGWVFRDTRDGKNPSRVLSSGEMSILLSGCKQEHHGLHIATGNLARAWRIASYTGLQPKLTMVSCNAESPGNLTSATPTPALLYEDSREPPGLIVVGGYVTDDWDLAMEFPALPHHNRSISQGLSAGASTPIDFNPMLFRRRAQGIPGVDGPLSDAIRFGRMP